MMTKPSVTVSPMLHRGAHRIKVDFPFREVVISQIKMYQDNGRTGANPYAPRRAGNGYRLKLMQGALGHESIKTTERYLHLASDAFKKLRSPADRLNLFDDNLPPWTQNRLICSGWNVTYEILSIDNCIRRSSSWFSIFWDNLMLKIRQVIYTH